MCGYVSVCAHVYICVCMCVYVYVYTCICVHMHGCVVSADYQNMARPHILISLFIDTSIYALFILLQFACTNTTREYVM